MTTTVTVNAHCASDHVEVKVDRVSKDSSNCSSHILQDGNSINLVVYDDISITVKEVEKTAAETE